MNTKDILKILNEGLLKIDCNGEYEDSVSLDPDNLSIWFIDSKTSRTVAFFDNCPSNVPFLEKEVDHWTLKYSWQTNTILEAYLK